MYKFVDTIEQRTERPLPSEALFLDGRTIESQIDGYRTLSVGGRELLSQDVESLRRAGGNGSIQLRSSYPSRVITIRYELKAATNSAFREAFIKLNKLLIGQNRELRFNDEPSFVFYGTLSEVGEVPQGVNTITSEFSFFCADPFKYTDEIVVSGVNTVTLNFDDSFQTTPDRIVVYPAIDTSTITLITGYKEVQLVGGSFLANGFVTIDFNEQSAWNENGSMMDKFALHSNLDDYYLNSGQPITFVEGGRIEVAYREVAL